MDDTVKWARKLSSELRPSILDDLGIVAAIEWYVKDFQDRTGIDCTFNSTLENIVLDREKSTALFRICQESLTNVAKHSRATKVEITLKESEGKLILEVSDNGKGITKDELASTKSFGLLGIRERSLIFNGELEIKGFPNKGTTVTVSIPHNQ